jgi:hypothetical protein
LEKRERPTSPALATASPRHERRGSYSTCATNRVASRCARLAAAATLK